MYAQVEFVVFQFHVPVASVTPKPLLRSDSARVLKPTRL